MTNVSTISEANGSESHLPNRDEPEKKDDLEMKPAHSQEPKIPVPSSSKNNKESISEARRYVSRHHSEEIINTSRKASDTSLAPSTTSQPRPIAAFPAYTRSHSRFSNRSGLSNSHGREASNGSASLHSRQPSVPNDINHHSSPMLPIQPSAPSDSTHNLRLQNLSNSSAHHEKPTLILYPRRSIIMGSSGHINGNQIGSQSSFHASSDNVSPIPSNIVANHPSSVTSSRENIASPLMHQNHATRNSIQSIPEGQVANVNSAPGTLLLSQPLQQQQQTANRNRESYLGSRNSLLARSFNRTGVISSYIGPNSGVNDPLATALATVMVTNSNAALIGGDGAAGHQTSATMATDRRASILSSKSARRGSMLGMTQDGQVINLSTVQLHQNPRQSMEPVNPSAPRSRPVSIISLKQLMKLKEAAASTTIHDNVAENLVDIGTRTQAKKDDAVAVIEPTMPEVYQNTDYFDYVMYSQRHASMNFITRIDSNEITWETQKQLPLKMIGTYLLGDKIGKGAFGKVKEGICSETLQRVAVKIIGKKRLRKVQHGLENTLREIKLLRRLKHKNIVTLVDVFAKVEDDMGNVGIFPWFSTIEEEPIVWLFDDGSEQEKNVSLLKWYLIFHFYPCSLQVLLDHSEGNKLPIDEAHRYFVQLMEGISYLHSQSVVHRDIKPGNLLITTDGVLKISDFGIAEQFDPYTEGSMMSEVFAGTHLFLAPEVVEGSTMFDGAKVDVWACGVTLYNMVTGKFPFEFNEDNDLMQLYESIQQGEFSFPENIPEDLQDLIRRMLQKNPVKRLNDEQVLNHTWSQTYFHAKTAPHILAYPPPSGGETSEPSPHTPSPQSSKISPTSPAPHQKMESAQTRSQFSQAGEVNTSISPLEKTSGVIEPISVQITPTESTMIPYLESMFQQEIEADLAQTGGVSEWLHTSSSEDINDKARRKKFIGIFKGLFGSQKTSSPIKKK